MPYADLGEFRLYYEDTGPGNRRSGVRSDGPETLIFLHGFTLDSRLWGPQAEFFGGEYRVIRPDARGHGRSEAPPTGYSRDDRMDDLLRLVDSLGIDRFHLAGLSMGGATGIGFALKYPTRLRSLILVSTGAAGFSTGKRMARLDRMAKEDGVEAAHAKWMAWNLSWYKGEQEWIRVLMDKMMRGFSRVTWADPMRGRYPRTYDLDNVHKITVPTYIVTGELDRVFVPLSRKLHERIKGSSLVIYKGIGHIVNLELPERFNSDLKVFLESVPR